MNCIQIKEILPLYMEGITESDETKEIEDHLSVCSACQNEVDELKELQEKMKTIASIQMPAALDHQLQESIRTEGKKIRARHRRKNLIRLSSFAAVFIVGIFSLIINGNLENLLTKQSDEKPEALIEVARIKEASPEDLALQGEISATLAQLEDPYRTLLQEELGDQEYELLHWEEIQPEGVLIEVEVKEVDNKGDVVWNTISFRGQDGEIWKIE